MQRLMTRAMALLTCTIRCVRYAATPSLRVAFRSHFGAMQYAAVKVNPWTTTRLPLFQGELAHLW